ncbi:MAG: hypothetical protein ACLUR5_18365 [Eubacterium ventriosum]
MMTVQLSPYYGVPSYNSTTVQLSKWVVPVANELFRLFKSVGMTRSGTVTKLSPTMVYRSSCGEHKERK